MTLLTLEQLDTWRQQYRARDEACVWPGPRPLTSADETLLVGRDDDGVSFLTKVRSHQLVLLYGDSGVGKTSLLDASLRPRLRSEGYTVAVCRDWGGDADELAPNFIGRRIAEALRRDEHHDFSPDARIFRQIDEAFGDTCVVVLDQFEELIRYNTRLKSAVDALVLNIERKLRTKVVLSFRSEYLHEMRVIEEHAGAFSLDSVFLEPVGSEYGREIILAPSRRTTEGSSPREIIDESAVKEISKLWSTARAQPLISREGVPIQIGLLHLQGLLYALGQSAPSGVVTSADLDSLREEAGRDSGAGQLFRFGLERAAQIKLNLAANAAVDVGMSPFLIAGVKTCLRESVGHLSSGGYKLVRDTQDLAEMALEEQLDVLRGAVRNDAKSLVEGQDDARPVVKRWGGRVLFEQAMGSLMASVCDTSIEWAARGQGTDAPDADAPQENDVGIWSERTAIARAADHALSAHPDWPLGTAPYWRVLLQPGAHPSSVDAQGVSVGPLAGCSPTSALIEELRRYALALVWLVTANIVRVTRPGDSTPMVSLIHDGFGDALKQWSSFGEGAAPADGFRALTWPAGKVFEWFPGTAGFDELQGDTGAAAVHVNLSWRGDTIMGAHFRNVVLVNCDLRGAYFLECRFDGVTLVNCRLDGAMFTDCTIVGSPGPLPDDDDSNPVTKSAENPRYFIDSGDPRLTGVPLVVAELSRYVGCTGGTGLVADAAGRIAVVANAEAAGGGDAARGPWQPTLCDPRYDGTQSQIERTDWWEPALHGLAIYGSRLSALTLRKLRFEPTTAEDRGMVSFRSVTGSGLDVVEVTDGSQIEIFSSSLRHTGFTCVTPASDVVVTVTNSVFAQSTFGAGLAGSCVVRDSLLVQAWNQAPDAFKAEAFGNSHVLDLVGVEVSDTCVKLPIVDLADGHDATKDGLITEAREREVRLRNALDAIDYRRSTW